ncbi:MAG: ABC transporter substrate-binding protein [Bacteroidia bacterium]|nr:ABC transporter substrate-binding protein [Bacteroidia bacterium]
MRKFIAIITTLLAACFSASAQKIVFMPHWLPQAQFAGYYAALENGFYADEGLDVEIRHLSANTRKRSTSYLKSGEIDITSMMLINAMSLQDSGMDLVNILQISQNTGLCCVTKNPIKDFESLDGMKIGKWTTGYSEFAMMAAEEKNISIEWIPLLNNINAFIAEAVDATLCYTFNEYIQLYLATGKDWSGNTIRMADIGYNFPDDGIYVTAGFYEKNREAAEKFARASRRGWEWAAKHPEETVDICLDYMKRANITSNRIHQRMMLDEMLRLQKNPQTGVADFAKVDRKVFEDMSNKAVSAGIILNDVDYDKMFRP